MAKSMIGQKVGVTIRGQKIEFTVSAQDGSQLAGTATKVDKGGPAKEGHYITCDISQVYPV